RRLEQMRSDALGFVLHLEGGVEDRGAADGETATAAGAVAHRRVERVTVLDDDLVEIDAEMVGDDLRERRLVPLAVSGRAGERGHPPARLPPDYGALEGPEAAHLDVARHADAEQVSIALLEPLALLLAHVAHAGELERLGERAVVLAAVVPLSR